VLSRSFLLPGFYFWLHIVDFEVCDQCLLVDEINSLGCKVTSIFYCCFFEVEIWESYLHYHNFKLRFPPKKLPVRHFKSSPGRGEAALPAFYVNATALQHTRPAGGAGLKRAEP